MVRIQFCSNEGPRPFPRVGNCSKEGPRPFPRGVYYEIAEIQRINLHLFSLFKFSFSSSESQSQLQSNSAQNILGL